MNAYLMSTNDTFCLARHRCSSPEAAQEMAETARLSDDRFSADFDFTEDRYPTSQLGRQSSCAESTISWNSEEKTAAEFETAVNALFRGFFKKAAARGLALVRGRKLISLTNS